jgi:acyl transferase domain-containing protein
MNPGTDWIEQGRRLLETFRSATESPAGEHGSDCRWCPVCQTAAVVRGERPEVTAALADVLTTAAAALRTFAEGGASAPGVDVEEEAGQGDPPAVQQIDIA